MILAMPSSNAAAASPSNASLVKKDQSPSTISHTSEGTDGWRATSRAQPKPVAAMTDDSAPSLHKTLNNNTASSIGVVHSNDFYSMTTPPSGLIKNSKTSPKIDHGTTPSSPNKAAPKNQPGHGNATSRTVYPSAEFSIPANGAAVEPRKPDVLLGRGRPFHVHPGNRRLHDIVDQFKPVYAQSQRLEKNAIVVQVMRMVHEGGGRFLGRNEQKQWTQVSSTVAHKKVSHLLRERPHKAQQAKMVASLASAPVGSFLAQAQSSSQANHAYPPKAPGTPPVPSQQRMKVSVSEAEAATSLLSFAKPLSSPTSRPDPPGAVTANDKSALSRKVSNDNNLGHQFDVSEMSNVTMV